MRRPFLLTLCIGAVAACSDRHHVREAGPTVRAAPSVGQGDDADGGSVADPVAGPEHEAPLRLLVFTRTEGYRHEAILLAKLAFMGAALDQRWSLQFTEEATDFTPERLGAVDVVVFLMTSGDVLDGPEERALERFVREGGGFVGIHSASDTEYGWPFYRELVGEWFRQHPAIASARVRVEAREHPITRGLDDPWERTDEWYDFRENPRARVNVLLTLDESSYPGGTMGEDHPIAWTREVDLGRAFYTGMGHTPDSWQEHAFFRHVRQGVNWAGQRVAAE